MGVHQTKTFQSGNSVAIRLPKELGIEAGTSVTIERHGRKLIVRRADEEDPEEAKRDLAALLNDLRSLRVGVVQPRDIIDVPVRDTGR